MVNTAAVKVDAVTLGQLPIYCKTFVSSFASRQLILLSGDLGAGKTTFVTECVRQLGGDIPDSPTFSIINDYGKNIYHVDLYRLENEADIDSTGFWDLFSEPEALVFVEWSEKVPEDQWPLSWSQRRLSIKVESSGVRRMTIEEG